MIKNIIFDFGNVICDLNYELTVQAFERLGAKNFSESYAWFQETELNKLFELGKVTIPEFRQQFKKFLGIEHVNDDEFDCAWNAMLGGIAKVKLDFLKKLRAQYRLYLFSNTNALHLPRAFEICYRDTGYKNLDDFFDRTYYSYVFGYRKPDIYGFNKILEENNLLAEETLFIDDYLPYIRGAELVGIRGLHLTSNKSILDVLS